MIKKIPIYFLTLFISIFLESSNNLPIIDYGSISHPEIGTEGMVVSQRKIASEVGAEILRQGGNAV